ncbi:hypothetical protein TNCV_2789761 [Trichonephila clavipes]|nr:hypothetical protein TNCV_2789761 [Trichonephila clavipes]
MNQTILVSVVDASHRIMYSLCACIYGLVVVDYKVIVVWYTSGFLVSNLAKCQLKAGQATAFLIGRNDKDIAKINQAIDEFA